MMFPEGIKKYGTEPVFTPSADFSSVFSSFSGLDPDRLMFLPGFCDVHVHFREPGFSYKETIRTGARAAAAAGTTAVCTMPNLNPVPDSVEHLRPQLEKIKETCIQVLPYGSITRGEKGQELADLEALAPYVVAFSDDGVGVADDGLMWEAMRRSDELGKVIAGHCEDMRYEDPREREWRELERNIRLSDETGCAFHACHLSTVESVSLIRDAKKSHLNVSCETAPHYLLLNRDLLEDHGRFRMNPPVQAKADQEALLEALSDGTIDMIATDHAPHSAEEKSRGFRGSLNGVVGLESAFPTLYTGLVKTGMLSLEQLVERMAFSPRKRFGIPLGKEFALWDLGTEYVLDASRFQSLGHSCPFDGWKVLGRCLMTVMEGFVVFTTDPVL